MEHLNRQQIVLLAILVSFVSSIATGIVTVTLMQQAPPAVTQTINRVVERTIETVIPAKTPTAETRIVTEEAFVVSAIEKTGPSVVSIMSLAEDGTVLESIGNGVIVSEDGMLVTDSSSAPGGAYQAVTSDGSVFLLSRLADKKGFALFKISPKDPKNPPRFQAVTLGDSGTVKVGQTIISLGDSAMTGIISGFSYEKAETSSSSTTTAPATEMKTLSSIRTSTNARDNPGSAIISLDGKTVGVVIFKGGTKVSAPSNLIKEAVEEIKKKNTSSQLDPVKSPPAGSA